MGVQTAKIVIRTATALRFEVIRRRRPVGITIMALLVFLVSVRSLQGKADTAVVIAGPGSGSTSAAPLHTEIPIRATAAHESAPDVVFGSLRHEYLVVWREITGSQAAVMAQRISAAGALIGPIIVVADSDPGTNGAYAAVAYNLLDDEYLVVWDRWFPSGFNGGIVAQRLTGSGAKVGVNFWILDRHWGEVRPDVAFLPDRAEYLVAWHDYRYPPGGTRGNIFGQRLLRDGELTGSEISIVEIDGNQWTPKLAAVAGGDAYVVAWVDARNGNDVPLIFARSVSGNGATVGPEVRVDEGGMGHWYPAVLYNPQIQEVLVAWQDHRVPETPRASVRRFSASLSPLAPSQAPRVGISHGRPALAFNLQRGEYYLAWMEGEPHQVGGQRWSLAGQAIGTPEIVAPHPYEQSAPAIAASTTNSDLLLVWEDYRQGTSNADIYGVLIGQAMPTATPTPTVTPSPTFTSTPSPTATPTFTPSPSFTPTATVTPTPSATPSITPIPSPVPSPTPTALPNECRLYEPNDNLVAAAGPFANGQVILAYLCPGDPDDFYFIDLPADTRVVDARLANLSGALNADLYLYDPDDVIVGRSTQPGVSSERIQFNPLFSGRYKVRVHAISGWNTMPYSLVVFWSGTPKSFLPFVTYQRPPTPTPTATPSSTPTPTITPTPGPCQRYEPNDSLSSAFGPLANGSVIEVALCDGDPEDYYQVALAGAATLRVDLDNLPAGTDYDLYLYDATAPQNYLARSVNVGTTPESIQINLSSGSYALRIYPSTSGRSNQPYRLAVNWAPEVDIGRESMLELPSILTT